jgi:hypothetical protein
MAETKAGLPDPANINFYGAQDTDVNEYQKSLQDSIDALKQRYENPNWFNVAAGFFKPQLGGFAASLGSASQALGENLEKQRESQLPVAQMRAQLAASKIAMGQRSTGAKEFSDWEAEGRPMEKLPALVTRLSALGSPQAASAKALLDMQREQQASDTSALTLFTNQKATDLALARQQFDSKVIPLSEYNARLKEIQSRQPPSFITSKPQTKPEVPTSGTGKPEVTAPEAVATAPGAPALTPAAAETAPPPSAEVPTKTGKKVLTSPLALGDEVGMTQAQIDARKEQANDYRTMGSKTYAALQDVASPTKFNDFVTPVDNALGLLGWGKTGEEKKAAEAKANKAMNVLSGDAFNGVLALINQGVGGKVGDLYANINIPIETFVRANFPPEMQTYAKDLALNLAKVSIAQQRLGGVSQTGGRNIEYELYGSASPSMNSDPVSALKALLHLRTSLYHAKSHHDFISDVDTGKNETYSVDKASPTRLYDIINSTPYQQLSEKWLKQHADIEKAFGARGAKP